VGQQVEIDRAERAIKDAEIRLYTIQNQLNAIDMEYARLINIQYLIENNIVNLKKEKVIALAGSYKKAKMELMKVQAHINIVGNNKTAVTRMRNDAQVFLDRCKKEYDNMLESFKNNVLFGNFGRRDKDGQS
jgi:hypothetical protein